jgi:type 1 fimbriae regulatory protein FimB
MLEDSAQSSKVEQSEVGQVLRFPSKDERHLFKPPIAPVEKKGTSPNKGYEATGRTREHLTPNEMDRLLDAVKKFGRESCRHRNHTIVLMMYRHGLRVAEAASLRWSDVSLEDGSIYVRRLKGSKDSTHPLQGDEIRALRRLQRESKTSPYLFVDSKGTPLKETAIASMIKRAGEGLLGFPIHSHMMRHSCGHYLASKGIDTRTIQDYLGHSNIMHTVRYTQLSANKFRNLWG